MLGPDEKQDLRLVDGREEFLGDVRSIIVTRPFITPLLF